MLEAQFPVRPSRQIGLTIKLQHDVHAFVVRIHNNGICFRAADKRYSKRLTGGFAKANALLNLFVTAKISSPVGAALQGKIGAGPWRYGFTDCGNPAC